MAVQNVVTNQPRRLTRKMFNEASIVRTICQPEPDPLSVYSAGRTLMELTFWRWIEEHNPHFVANCVVPDANFGRLLNPETDTNLKTSIMGMLKRGLAGQLDTVNPISKYLQPTIESCRMLISFSRSRRRRTRYWPSAPRSCRLTRCRE